MDLIDRQQAIDKIKDWMKFIGYSHSERNVMECTIQMLEELPLTESEIIRCEDCKWWDQKFDDSPMGYCMAAKHNYYSPHWEINIQRTYGKNFFCADAEPKEEGEEDE